MLTKVFQELLLVQGHFWMAMAQQHDQQWCSCFATTDTPSNGLLFTVRKDTWNSIGPPDPAAALLALSAGLDTIEATTAGVAFIWHTINLHETIKELALVFLWCKLISIGDSILRRDLPRRAASHAKIAGHRVVNMGRVIVQFFISILSISEPAVWLQGIPECNSLLCHHKEGGVLAVFTVRSWRRKMAVRFSKSKTQSKLLSINSHTVSLP